MLGCKLQSETFKTKKTRAGLVRVHLFWKFPLWNLRPSIINSIPCDQIAQRAYSDKNVNN